MKKKSKFVKIILLAFCFILLFATSASAVVPYTSYTYNVGGLMQESPHAYVPLEVIDSKTIIDSFSYKASDLIKQKYDFEDVNKELNTPTDVFVDDLNQVYIADSGNDRILCLDENYVFRLQLDEFTNDQGVPDALSTPTGVFVTDSEIYVADKDKSRIVVFDKVGNFVDIVPEPASDVMPEGAVYKPIALAVDNAGRIYVVSATTNYGVISLNRDGSFNGFIGPQKVTYNLFEYVWSKFQTAAQRAASEIDVSTEYNNITIDSDGFIYLTTDSIDEINVDIAIQGHSKSGDYAPVKKLNPNGNDVMNRNGLWPPSGEIDYQNFAKAGFVHFGPSDIVDVALGPNGTWSIIDTERSKVFSYDDQGNLLYAFCDEGDQIGNIQKLIGIAYQGTRILLLDSNSSSITVYKRTEYGDLIDAAIKNTLDKNYNEAVKYYLGILQRNNNYDSAYVGIGQSLYRNGDYVQAMQYFRDAYDIKNYSEAYQLYRKDWIEKNVWVLPLIVIVLCIALSQFFKWANIYNKKQQKVQGKHSFVSEIVYGFHVIFHPFDGFWDIKHEKRGSVRGATFWLGVTVLIFVYEGIGQGYLLSPGYRNASILFQASSILLPLLLWAIANWCLTTLFEGEGTFKDVYIASCYSLIPLPLLILPKVIISNFVTLDEVSLLLAMVTIAYFWLGILIFFAMMVIHDYTLGKNILTTIGTIVGVAIIMFIAVLFSSLLTKIFTFGYNIFIELKYRYWS